MGGEFISVLWSIVALIASVLAAFFVAKYESNRQWDIHKDQIDNQRIQKVKQRIEELHNKAFSYWQVGQADKFIEGELVLAFKYLQIYIIPLCNPKGEKWTDAANKHVTSFRKAVTGGNFSSPHKEKDIPRVQAKIDATAENLLRVIDSCSK